MKTVAFVPMKTNNERLPNKNTKSLTDGKPLCNYILDTLQEIMEQKAVDETYVFCSNPSVMEYVPNTIRYLTRDTSLDQNSTGILDVLKAFAGKVEADVYVLAHATAPFLKARSIIKGIEAVKNGEYDSALTVLRQQDFLWKGGMPFNYSLDNVARTQDLDPLYIETTGLYIFTRKLILEKGRRIGDKPFLIMVDKIEATDINDPVDFEIADAIHHFGLTNDRRKQ